MSHPIVVTVAVVGLDFNGGVAAIRQAAAQACSEVPGLVLRAVERQAQRRAPDRWVNRGPVTRRRLPWGAVAVRGTRVRERETGRTYNLADRLLGLRPYVGRGGGADHLRVGGHAAVPGGPARVATVDGFEMQRDELLAEGAAGGPAAGAAGAGRSR